MPLRHVDGVRDALDARARETDHVAIDARLGAQEPERGVEIAESRLPPVLAIRPVVRAAGLAVPAHVDRQRVDPRGREAPGDAVPRVAVAVGLMEQDRAGARRRRREEGAFKMVPSAAVTPTARGDGSWGEAAKSPAEETKCSPAANPAAAATRRARVTSPPGVPPAASGPREQNSPSAARCMRLDWNADASTHARRTSTKIAACSALAAAEVRRGAARLATRSAR